MWSEDDPGSNNGGSMDESNPASDAMDEINPAAIEGHGEYLKLGRERSMSVPCRNETADVETVVSKAKRASTFLWMLLHSQVRRHVHLARSHPFSNSHSGRLVIDIFLFVPFINRTAVWRSVDAPTVAVRIASSFTCI
jgi:hypothetical protein